MQDLKEENEQLEHSCTIYGNDRKTHLDEIYELKKTIDEMMPAYSLAQEIRERDDDIDCEQRHEDKDRKKAQEAYATHVKPLIDSANSRKARKLELI